MKLLKDFSYFTLILLLFLAIGMVWLPLKILEIFFKKKYTLKFISLFTKVR